MSAKNCIPCIVIGGIALAAAITFAVYMTVYRDTVPAPVVTNFDECVAAGYPVGESHPPQCSAPSGTFVQQIPLSSFPNAGDDTDGENGTVVPPTNSSDPDSVIRASGGCSITGCSRQICAEEEMITTCEFRSEYTCYQSAQCGRLQDGACGWIETPELQQCLNDVSIRNMELPE